MDLIWFIFVCTFYLIWLETCYLLCNITSINHCYQKKKEDYEIDSTNNEEINVSWDHFCTRKTQRESRRTTKKICSFSSPLRGSCLSAKSISRITSKQIWSCETSSCAIRRAKRIRLWFQQDQCYSIFMRDVYTSNFWQGQYSTAERL